MADEKYFYHSFVSPCFALECPCFARVSGVIVICSEIIDCGELVQNGAYCY